MLTAGGRAPWLGGVESMLCMGEALEQGRRVSQRLLGLLGITGKTGSLMRWLLLRPEGEKVGAGVGG